MPIRGDKLRAIAATALSQIIADGQSLSYILPQSLAKVPADSRPLLQELLFGTLRQGPLLDAYLEQLLKKPLKQKDSDVFALLLLGLYQLKFMRIPQHAAVNETVRATATLKKGWAKGLVNGVLRQFDRNHDAIFAKLDASAKSAHPEWLLNAITHHWPKETNDIIAANNSYPPLTLRVNTKKSSREDYLALLTANGISASATELSPVGITLDKPTAVEIIPGFMDGVASVQDEAAQLTAQLLDPQPEQRVLDLCAAPGGKTCHLLEYCPDIEMTAIDVSEDRLLRVAENLERLKLSAELRPGDATEPEQWYDGTPFDRILVDAPCSGSGVMRRNPDIKWLRYEEDISSLAQQQLAILQSAWEVLALGGELLYATCSIFPEENGLLSKQFAQQTKDAEIVPLSGDWGIDSGAGKQLLPKLNGHDGFFYAKFRKKA